VPIYRGAPAYAEIVQFTATKLLGKILSSLPDVNLFTYKNPGFQKKLMGRVLRNELFIPAFTNPTTKATSSQ
jgi:hypothetical protein